MSRTGALTSSLEIHFYCDRWQWTSIRVCSLCHTLQRPAWWTAQKTFNDVYFHLPNFWAVAKAGWSWWFAWKRWRWWNAWCARTSRTSRRTWSSRRTSRIAWCSRRKGANWATKSYGTTWTSGEWWSTPGGERVPVQIFQECIQAELEKVSMGQTICVCHLIPSTALNYRSGVQGKSYRYAWGWIWTAHTWYWKYWYHMQCVSCFHTWNSANDSSQNQLSNLLDQRVPRLP